MTPEREAKMRQVIRNRQPSLGIVMENVHDPHNISAVMRTCDAVGVQDIFIINDKEGKPPKLGKKSSASAKKWLTMHYFDQPEKCFRELRKQFSSIYSTYLNDESSNLYDIDMTTSIALVFGNEHNGVSEKVRALCDGNFTIPQVGMIESLNISVSCAVALYEAFRQRQQKGMYDDPGSNPSEMEKLFNHWAKK